MMKIVVDAEDGMLGRVASYVAKQALFGKEVAVVNCEKAVVTGNRRTVIGEFIISRRRGGSSRKGPRYPKSSERIMKRTIRGMLPYKQGRGDAAFKRIKCYNSIPNEFVDVKKITMKREIIVKAIKLSEISKEL